MLAGALPGGAISLLMRAQAKSASCKSRVLRLQGMMGLAICAPAALYDGQTFITMLLDMCEWPEADHHLSQGA